MASILPDSARAGAVFPVEDQRLIMQLIEQAAALAQSNLQNGLGLISCEECSAQWLLGEKERHVASCRVGAVRATLRGLRPNLSLHDSDESHERSSAEPAQNAAAAAGERPRGGRDFGEPWGFGVPEADGFIPVRDRSLYAIARVGGPYGNSGTLARARRLCACVSFCAGVPTEKIEAMAPLAEHLYASGAGVDALLGKKGGAK